MDFAFVLRNFHWFWTIVIQLVRQPQYSLKLTQKPPKVHHLMCASVLTHSPRAAHFGVLTALVSPLLFVTFLVRVLSQHRLFQFRLLLLAQCLQLCHGQLRLGLLILLGSLCHKQ